MFVFYNIIIYEYAVLGYNFFWQYFVDSKADENPDQGYYCNWMYICYLTLYDQTNKEPGGIGSFLDFFNQNALFENNYRSLYDITFKLLVPIVLLSIVKGVIVDTFGSLRELDQKKAEDMESKCFICGIPRESFDKIRTKTFAEHIKSSHNMWDYVHLIVYLQQKNVTEHNGEELYVYENFLKKKYDWIPSKRCLEIDDSEEADINQRINEQLQESRKKISELRQGYQQVTRSLNRHVQSLQFGTRANQPTHAEKYAQLISHVPIPEDRT